MIEEDWPIDQELTIMSNFFPQKDCSLNYVNPENNRIVNIFQGALWDIELSNSIGEIYLDNYPENDCFLSILNFMSEAEDKLIIQTEFTKYIEGH